MSGVAGGCCNDRVGADNPVTLCDPGILTDQAAEPVLAQNPDVGVQSGWMRTPGAWALLQCPVRPVRVVVIDVPAQGQAQVPLTGDQCPVQALAAGAGDPPLGDRIRPGRPAGVLMIRTPLDQRGDLGADRRPSRPVRVSPLLCDQA